MGRYYTGDIQGKFWFGVQSSTDASFFGGQEFEPNYVDYYFNDDDLSDIKDGLKKCEKELGDYIKKLDDFFSKVDSYNDEIVAKNGLDPKEFNKKLEWYARYKLGKKIYKCVKDNKICEFQAEL